MRSSRDAVVDADWIHLTEGESIQWIGRPSPYTIAGAMVGGAVLVIAGIGLTVWLNDVVAGTTLPGWIGYAPALLSVVGLAWVAYTYLDWLRLLYVVTDEEIYVKFGLVSRDVTQIRLDRVQNTASEQGVVQRVLGFGDVRVYTAGTNTEDVTFKNVTAPGNVTRTLTSLLSDRANRQREEDATSEATMD